MLLRARYRVIGLTVAAGAAVAAGTTAQERRRVQAAFEAIGRAATLVGVVGYVASRACTGVDATARNRSRAAAVPPELSR